MHTIGAMVCDPCFQDNKGFPGIDPDNFDLKVSPKENFYDFSNGGWREKVGMIGFYFRYNCHFSLVVWLICCYVLYLFTDLDFVLYTLYNISISHCNIICHKFLHTLHKKQNPIPAEYSNWNTFIALRDLNLERLKVILEELESGNGSEGEGSKSG